MKKLSLSIILIFVVTALIATPLSSGCAEKGPAAGELPEVEWILASTETTTGHHTVQDMQKFADGVSRRTGGKFNIRIALEGELGFKRDEFLGALQKNDIQMSQLGPGLFTPVMPEMGVFVLPFLQDGSREQLYKMEQATREMTLKTFEEKFGIGYAGLTAVTSQEIISSKKIDDFTNLNGIKIRVWRELDAKSIELLGGVPVYMPGSECYPAMQRGVVTAVNTGLPAMLDRSLQEVGKYVYRVGLPPGIHYIVFNIEAFNALPDKYQRILYEEGRTLTDQAKDTFLHVDSDAAAELESSGVQIIELPADQRAAVRGKVKSIWEGWASESPTNKAYYDAVLAALGI